MNIKINIVDDRHYADVAAVVYRPEFTKEVKRIKVALEKKLPKDYLAYSHVPTEKELELVDTEIEKSRKTLYLQIVFKRVILAAVFTDTITANDYFPTYLERKSNGTFDKEGATPDDTYKIVLSAGVRDEDVIATLQEYRDQIGNIKGIEYYKYIHNVWPISKSKPSLKKHMEWYRDFKNGISIEEIQGKEIDSCKAFHHKEEKKDSKKRKIKPKDCICYDISTIRKGIEAYEEHIMKVPTF